MYLLCLGIDCNSTSRIENFATELRAQLEAWTSQNELLVPWSCEMLLSKMTSQALKFILTPCVHISPFLSPLRKTSPKTPHFKRHPVLEGRLNVIFHEVVQ